MANNPARLPSYLSLDSTSQWHVGALQSVALESMTMPSRLRSSENRRGTLQDLEEAFNSTGKRRIAKLEMSIADPNVLSETSSHQIDHGQKVGPQASEGDGDQLSDLDFEFFSKDYRVATSARANKKEHIFGRAEAARGEWNVPDGFGRGTDPHNRFGDGPTVQR